MKKLPIYILLLVIITCSKDSSEDTSSVYVAPPTNTTNTPSTTVIQYTITVSAGEGGSVSTTGGTYNDGTSQIVNLKPYTSCQYYFDKPMSNVTFLDDIIC